MFDNGIRYYLINSTTPKQEYKERGYFRVIEKVRYSSDEEPIVYKKLLITGKGQVFFTRKFLEEKEVLDKV